MRQERPARGCTARTQRRSAAVVRFSAALLAALLLQWAGAANAGSWPLIREIAFSGNDTTRRYTIQRELVVHVGDPADPAAIERSRQAVLDLGLFRSVEARQEPVRDGVRVTFVVREKWYVLPLPRLEGNINGDYGYGGQVTWNNVGGYNQTLRLLAVERKLDDVDRSGQFSYEAGYSVPFIGDTRNSVSGGIAHTAQDSIDPSGHPYGEMFDSAQIIGSRALSPGPPSRGWNAGGGVMWQRESTTGPFAPPSQGKATALVANLVYNGSHYLVYSEHGMRLSAQVQYAADGVASDYGYNRETIDYRQDWQLGQVPHQDLEAQAGVGSYFGGAPGHIRNAFGLGGSQRLRGYETSFVQGDFDYYLSGAYLRPVGWQWLRFMAVAEAGSAYPKLGQTGGRPVYASIGLGFRVRVTWLVNIELEGGVALPLVDHDAPRIFGGKVPDS
jgi:outer membrane protein assembly factor BamA